MWRAAEKDCQVSINFGKEPFRFTSWDLVGPGFAPVRIRLGLLASARIRASHLPCHGIGVQISRPEMKLFRKTDVDDLSDGNLKPKVRPRLPLLSSLINSLIDACSFAKTSVSRVGIAISDAALIINGAPMSTHSDQVSNRLWPLNDRLADVAFAPFRVLLLSFAFAQVVYYECRVAERGASGGIAVGLAPKEFADYQKPGAVAGSYALHGDNGFAASQTDPRPFAAAFKSADVVGCGA